MPITAITIENFKGIREPLRVELNPITMLFGPNSAGKSTIVQALHYAYEIFDRLNLDPDKTAIGGKAIDLGGFETIVYGRDLSRTIRFKIDLDLTNEDLPQYFDGYEDMGTYQFSEKQIGEIPMRAVTSAVEISVKWSQQVMRPILYRYKVSINRHGLAVIETNDDGKQVFMSSINPVNPVFLEGADPDEVMNIFERYSQGLANAEDVFEKIGPIFPALLTNFKMEKGIAGLSQPINIVGKNSALPKWGKVLEFHGPVWADEIDRVQQGNLLICLSSLIVGPGELIRDALSKMRYIGPIRDIPSRNFKPEKSPDTSRWASGLRGWDILYNANKGFIEEVNRWLTQTDRLNTGYRIESEHYREVNVDDPISLIIENEGALLEDFVDLQNRVKEIPVKSRISIREELSGMRMMPQDVGVGISQVLPIIVAALHIKEGILAVEQPELHIHPALQVALGDLFISRLNQSPTMFVLETHSEHLMLRLLRRIRETGEGELPPGKAPLSPEQLSVYYVEQGKDGISIAPIRIGMDGDFIDRWPKGFFDERMQELF